MRINDTKLTLVRFYQRSYINATLTADKKIRRSQSEAVMIQNIRVIGYEFERAGRVRGAQGIMSPAKTALAGPDRPALWCDGGSIVKSYGAAMTAALKF